MKVWIPPPPPSLSCHLTANQSAAAGRQAVVLYLGHNSRMPTQLTEPHSGSWRRWHQTAHWVKHVHTLRGNWEVFLRRVVMKKDDGGSWTLKNPVSPSDPSESQRNIKTNSPPTIRKKEQNSIKARDTWRAECAVWAGSDENEHKPKNFVHLITVSSCLVFWTQSRLHTQNFHTESDC